MSQTEFKQTIIIVTYDVNVAGCADTIVRIEDGKVL